MDNKDIAVEWFRIAEIDLLSAEYLQNMRPIPVEIICYHCQQSAEKYLKGFIALNGEEIRRTHDLVVLNKVCLTYDEGFAKLVEDCLMLTDYSVSVRYPFPMNVNEDDMQLALKSARRIKEYVLTKANL